MSGVPLGVTVADTDRGTPTVPSVTVVLATGWVVIVMTGPVVTVTFATLDITETVPGALTQQQ